MRAGTIVIAGGGATGSSLAFHLLADPAFEGRVIVVEKDPAYRLAASALSAASIRQQYSQAVNIAMSLHGLAFLREPARWLGQHGGVPDFGLHEAGYLYLADTEAGAETLRAKHRLQQAEQADIGLLDPDELAARFPWMNLSGVTLGSLGLSGEGWFDGWAVLQAFRTGARRLGAQYLTDEVVGLDFKGDRVMGARLRTGDSLACTALANCAGSGGSAIARMAGIDIPVQAKRRSVFAFTCRTSLPDAPLLIDTSGVWMRPEGRPGPQGQTFIAGWSPTGDDDPDWRDEDAESQAIDWPLFDEVIWLSLAARIPAFEQIRPGRAWTGPYDMNLFDHNAIIGPAGTGSSLYLCNGFSGHGLQHAAAAGRGLAELIVHGGFRTLDLSELGFDRIVENRPLLERNVI